MKYTRQLAFRQLFNLHYTCQNVTAISKCRFRLIACNLFLVILVAGNFDLVAQGIVTTDLHQGRAIISVPITTVQKGGIAIPVSLDYITAGVKVSDTDGDPYGLGWNLTGGGSVQRELKDLPDDKGAAGWLNSNSGNLVEGFTIANDGNMSACSDEINDINYLATNFPLGKDAEPDVFNISAPGLSCEMVFDKNHQPRIIPYKDFKITYTTDTYGINSFTVTNDQGQQYIFASGILTSKRASGGQQPLPYFSREYNQYMTEIQYYSKWYLTSITDASGNTVNFEYTSGQLKTQASPIETLLGNGSGTLTKKTLYTVSSSYTPKFLYKIKSSGIIEDIVFNYNQGYSFLQVLASVKLKDGRELNFNYHKTATPASGTVTNRLFLSGIYSNGCNALPPYQFYYQNTDYSTENSSLPAEDSKQQDIWGFYNASSDAQLSPQIYVYPYNPSYPNLERYRLNAVPGYTGTVYTLPGASRNVNPSVVAYGTLNKITYPTGGSTILEYETNSYNDARAQADFQGGGIRIKKITESDGISSANDIVKEFVYTIPGSALSSGQVIHMPSYSFTRPYSGSPGTQAYWDNSTVRSEKDLSAEPTEIMYSYVTMKQSGLGKTVFEYSSAGAFWDQTSGDWVPSIDYAGRTNCAASGEVVNALKTYPYAPDPNYSFERGLLKSVTAYNESNNPVNRKEFTYQRTGLIEPVRGLKLDDLDGFKTYSKYNIYTSVDNIIATERITEYDQNDPSKFLQINTVYSYSGLAHKNVTKKTETESDGTIKNTYLKYAKDYNASSAGDEATKALFGMQVKNINPVVESYNSVIRASETEKVISGKLTKFQSVANSYLNSTMYVPSQILDFTNSEGVSGFGPSQVLSGSTFQYHAAYRPALSFESYNRNGSVSTLTDRGKNIRSYHFLNNARLPVAVINGAKQNEVVYSGFETSLGEDENTSFVCTGCSSITDSRSGSNAISISGSGYLQKSLKKGTGSNYMLSCWLKSSSAGTITITLTSASALVRSYPLSYVSSPDWKYYELVVPVSEMTPEFTVKLQCGSVLQLDDVLFYPENADIRTYTYNKADDKLSETDVNGRAVYYEYDGEGRLSIVRDQEKNIVRKETYSSYNSTVSLVNPSFSYSPSSLIEGTNIQFSEEKYGNRCIEGITYAWNFGDGSGIVTGSNPSHTFANAGTYNVTLTANHPLYGSKSTTSALIVSLKPLSVSICGSGVINVDNCHVDAPLILSCSGFPSDSRHTYFNVNAISGCTGTVTYTYQWETSEDQVTWMLSGTGSGYSVSVNTAHNYSSYWIRCRITSSCGRTGVSNVMQFIGYSSSPDCL